MKAAMIRLTANSKLAAASVRSRKFRNSKSTEKSTSVPVGASRKVQALSSFLEIGRFANPAEKAEQMKNSLVGQGLKAALGVAGAGALGVLLDADDSEQGKRTQFKTCSLNDEGNTLPQCILCTGVCFI